MEALGRLVAGLAHEFGTPLNSILLIANNLAEDAPARLKKELAAIAKEAKRCGDLVSLLLGYSQTMARNVQDVEYAPVNLASWVNEIYEMVQAEEPRRKGKKNPKIDFELKVRDLPEIVAVPTLILGQVLENLLKNARYALREVNDAKIQVQIYQDLVEGQLILEVSDNGPGFTKEGRERAFEAFFSTKTGELSSGLGLYMCYYLLSHVCGRIVVAEHSGRGAILRISLPRLEALDEQVAVA
jgi:signal transduction histidine kinase